MSTSSHAHFEDVWVKKLTDKAALLQWIHEDGTSMDVWVPLSQLADSDDLEEGKIQDVSISKWFCDKEGVSYDS